MLSHILGLVQLADELIDAFTLIASYMSHLLEEAFMLGDVMGH